MNWLEKIDFMIDADRTRKYAEKYVVDITFLGNSWEDGELEELLQSYKLLPKQYIDFIKKYNTIGIAWVVFYGSKKRQSLSLVSQIAYLRSEGLPDEYFPFGKGPGGEIYAFNKSNQVIEFACDDYDFESPKVISDTLENFVDECLLGKRYAEFNSYDLDQDTFYDFMKLQGWL